MTVRASDATAADWMRYAEGDLAAAQSLRRFDGPSPRHAGWLAEQAVEKALRAALVASGTTPPVTHDLDELRSLLPPGWAVSERFPDLSRLSGWFVLAVYPGEWAVVTDPGAAEMVELGAAVVACVRDDIAAHRTDAL